MLEGKFDLDNFSSNITVDGRIRRRFIDDYWTTDGYGSSNSSDCDVLSARYILREFETYQYYFSEVERRLRVLNSKIDMLEEENKRLKEKIEACVNLPPDKSDTFACLFKKEEES